MGKKGTWRTNHTQEFCYTCSYINIIKVVIRQVILKLVDDNAVRLI